MSTEIDRTKWYPDNHSIIRENLVTVTQNGETAEYMPREVWESTAAERDEFRRVLAFINAWRVKNQIRDEELTRLLASVGEDDGTGRALAGLIDSIQRDGL